MNKIELSDLKDKRIAVTAGSRGIKKIDEILLGLIDVLKRQVPTFYCSCHGKPWWRNGIRSERISSKL